MAFEPAFLRSNIWAALFSELHEHTHTNIQVVDVQMYFICKAPLVKFSGLGHLVKFGEVNNELNS